MLQQLVSIVCTLQEDVGKMGIAYLCRQRTVYPCPGDIKPSSCLEVFFVICFIFINVLASGASMTACMGW